MAIEVETKDCTALSDAEIEEMADLCAESPNRYEIGMLSKQTEEWVLVTLASENGKLKGFSFCTLERIGGTPSVLIGLASVKRTSRRDGALRGIMLDQLHRAVMAFPDEDVLIGARVNDPGAFEAFKNLNSVIPRPDHKASGEERAWGRRLAKRFGIDGSAYDDRAFRITGDGNQMGVLDHESLKPEKIDPDVAEFFDGIDHVRSDAVVVFGWAMVEDLEKLA